MVDEAKIDWATLPELDVPFPSAINRHADAVHEGTAGWLRGLRVLDDEETYRRFHRTKIGRLAARFHPTAALDELQLISDWYGWMFLWDDLRDETDIGRHPDRLASRNGRLLEVLAGSGLPQDDPLARALRDLRERLISGTMTEEWVRRFVESVEEHFDSTVWEANNRALGLTPDLKSYIKCRPVTGGLGVDSQFVKIAEHAYPSPETRRSQILRRMSRYSDNAVCWANDIFSLDKEIRREDVHNLVLILQRAEGLTLQAAAWRAIEMHNSEVRSFVDSVSRLQALDGDAAGRSKPLVAVLQARMRGFVDWAQESGRYRSAVRVSPPGVPS